MKKHLLLVLVATLAFSSHLNAQIDLLSFGSPSFTVDDGSTATYTQSSSGITMNTTPALGDTWYNSAMTKLVADWSSFPGFNIAMSVSGTNPGLPFSLTLYDTSFASINEYQANTLSAGFSITQVPLLLTLPGNGNLSDVQYVQFSWGGGGSPVNTTVTGITAVPEPSTYALLGLAGLALGGYAMRRRKRA
jgi:hypothetical protein